jgi:thermitase
MGLAINLLVQAIASTTVVATPAGPAVSDEILVRYRDDVLSAPLGRRLSFRALRAEVVDTNEELRFSRLRLPEGVPLATALTRLRQDPNVEYAEPNYIATVHGGPDDPYFKPATQWALYKIGAPLAWRYATGATVKVADLDTGVQASHPDLVGRVVAQYDFVSKDGVAEDRYGHGTHTAGTIGASTYNATGVASLAYNVKLLCGKVLRDDGSGNYADVANGIWWAVNQGAKVINMSFGGPATSATLQNAIDYAWSKGVVVVASAGNTGDSKPCYPAYYKNALAVAATDAADARAGFSTFGSWVDVAAPGVNIVSTSIGSEYLFMSGTSMAAPQVSALAALVWSTSYGTSALAVRKRLIETGDPVTANFGTAPLRRINAQKAVAPTSP